MRQFALVIALVLLFTAKALATTYYVDINHAPGGNGASWAQASNDLQDILNNSAFAPGDQVHIAQGTYVVGTSVSDTLNLTADHIGVRIMGGFYGGTGPFAGARDIDAYPTILTGYINSTTRARHVISAVNIHNDITTAPIIVDGVTIREAYANGSANEDRVGAGAYVFDSSLNFLRCTFTMNDAEDVGGGL